MLAVNLFHMRAGKIVDRREFFWEELPEFVGATSGRSGCPEDADAVSAGGNRGADGAG